MFETSKHMRFSKWFIIWFAIIFNNFFFLVTEYGLYDINFLKFVETLPINNTWLLFTNVQSILEKE